ncbi:tyrosine-type recombinase/integrase [Caenimonas sedimenti]|nr:site-specific integrase [Caenimonas sedimenti]
MARELNRLKQAFVDTVQPLPGDAGTRLYADGGNLHLQVTPTGAKSWNFRFQLLGLPKSIGLGPTHTVTLEEARAESLRLRKMLLAGRDPKIELDRERHAARTAQKQTFRVFAQEFVKGLQGQHRNPKAHQQWYSSLETYVYPVIGDIPLADIDVHMVLAVLTKDDAWNKKPETMRRVRGRMERILGAAAVLGWRGPDNPARFTNYLSEVLPANSVAKRVVHHPALPYEQVPAFVKLLRNLSRSTSYVALDFLILTATRTGEVIGAQPKEFDLLKKTWTIPASRCKNGKAHRVPLSAAAFDLVEPLLTSNSGVWVFQGSRKGTHISQMSMLQVMRGLKERGLLATPAVPHGFRASFRSYAAAETEFPRELAEAALAHTAPLLERSYQRDDQLARRRELMDEWGKYCMSALASPSVDDRIGPH